MSSRDEFESWAVVQEDENGLPYFVFAKFPDGKYIDTGCRHAWKAWQASREQALNNAAYIADAYVKNLNRHPEAFATAVSISMKIREIE